MPAPSRTETARRSHRIRILLALLRICGDLERLEIAPEARRACRDVAGILAGVLAEERRTGRRR
jgi:hypothetical protein